MTPHIDSIAYPPRGLGRFEAARYIGVSPTKFDELVRAHKMPQGKRIGARVVWDRIELDACFSELGVTGNALQDMIGEARERQANCQRAEQAMYLDAQRKT